MHPMFYVPHYLTVDRITPAPSAGRRRIGTVSSTELSMGWVDPSVGLVWVGLGRDFSVFGGLGWVGSTTAKVLKF